jgi:hypothetical protein
MSSLYYPFDVLVMGEKISLAWGRDPNTGPKKDHKSGDTMHKIHIRAMLLVGNGQVQVHTHD